MTVVEFRPRADWGWHGAVLNSSGTPRRALSNEATLTVHYTGVPLMVGGKLRYPPDLDMVAFMNNLQAYAIGAKKPFEYNYCLPPWERPSVWEYAGGFQAAHSEGENLDAVGVLLVLAIDQEPTRGQIVALRWLRDDYLPSKGLLLPQAHMLPHHRMPGASTGCPGPKVMGRWDELEVPWQPPIEEDDMRAEPPELVRPKGYANEFLFFPATGEFVHGGDAETEPTKTWREKYGHDGHAKVWEHTLEREGHSVMARGMFTKAGLDVERDGVRIGN